MAGREIASREMAGQSGQSKSRCKGLGIRVLRKVGLEKKQNRKRWLLWALKARVAIYLIIFISYNKIMFFTCNIMTN